MNDTQLLTRLAEANAYGKEAPLPETIWTSELALREIERRMGMKPTESPDQPTVTSGPQQQEAAPPASAPDQVLNAPGQRTWPGRRRSLLVGVAAFVAVLFVGVAAWGIVAVLGEDDIPVAGTSDDPAIGAGPVASGGAGFEGVFAEDGATLDGPEAVTAGMYDFIVTNGSDLTASLVAWRFSDEAVLAEELATLEVGENQALQGPGQEFASGLLVATLDVAAGTDKTEAVLLTKGLYVFDWLTFDNFGITDHIWRVKVIEVGE